MDIKIYYEDKHIVVAEKPFGVSSQNSGGENMISLLGEKCQSEIYPVHRLDMQTTGLMVYAKDSRTASSLSAQIVEGVFEKRYLCVCHGRLDEAGEMSDLLYHDKLKNKSYTVKAKRKGVKEARLSYRSLDYLEKEELTLALIKLYTGRTHQIRVQLSSRAHPLYGDGKYGASDNARIALHSSYLSFNHPESGKKIRFESIPNGEIWDKFSKDLTDTGCPKM